MKDLHGFNCAEPDETALCEVDGRLHSMRHDYANITAFTNAVDKHPKIHITRDMLHPMSTGDESRALFLPVNEPFFKQVAQVWYEQGITEALELIAERQKHDNPLAANTASYALKVIEFLSSIRNVVQPHTNKNNRFLIASVSQVKDWFNSPVRCMAWHPHCTKIAIAASDDSVRIYSTESNLVPVLKSKLQRGVSCVAWRPLSASEIAVGCESCILIWTVDPNSVVTRPSSANSYLLRRVNHCPITSLVWSPRGEYLISAAAGDSTLLVWDVALDHTCSLKRVGNVGNTFLSFVQDGSKLLSCSTGLVFRVWECQQWQAERWNTSLGRVQSACWSPCGSVLLFVTSEEPLLYSLSCRTSGAVFAHATAAAAQCATPLLDLARVEVGGEAVGGLVQAMEWDPKGRHLAVLFKEGRSVAVFTTTVVPLLQSTPGVLISGIADEVPNSISFQRNFSEGSCLAIAWSSGRIQYFPLIYSDTRVHKSPRSFRRLDNLESSFNPYTSF